MSNSKDSQKLSDINTIETLLKSRNEDGSERTDSEAAENCLYAVTVTKKSSSTDNKDTTLESAQKSFISIHSTDQLYQIPNVRSQTSFEECNVEVISLNEVFPSTSEESFSNDDVSPTRRNEKHRKNKLLVEKPSKECTSRFSYVPTNSKSATGPGRHKETVEAQAPVYSDYDLPKNTLRVLGSNPGEPKMIYPDPPKKISKTMKKFLRNKDKNKFKENAKSNEKAISKLTTTRGILKDNRSGLECTGDSTHEPDDYNAAGEVVPVEMDFEAQSNYAKQTPDKNVSFNTQVVIIHFTGDLCVGQSIEELSKEKDQQARNSELRKTFLTKYNEFWPTQK
ncbi:unnamed protein product [Parnassius apollo]|uniref:(apollo) hypothetical protein n=1 Tax=Parnassius apollo TaxID=110799 RepID=A0A8S3W8K5_PARAO|nr:unnamed protein product [Parnassius apollo]